MNRIESLIEALDRSVREAVQGRELGILFSGGIDSCVIAQLARPYADVKLYTIGMPGAHDLDAAKSTASRLKMEWHAIILNEKMIRNAMVQMSSIIGTDDPLTISFEMPLHIVAQVADEVLLASGQGADELFGGYARYEKMDSLERRTAMRQDVSNLLMHGSKMEHGLAAFFSKEIRHPFLHPEVVELALQLPDELLIDEGIRKVALRHVARAIGLVEEADRKKKAAQYGSGVMRSMKAMAKRDGMTVGQWSRSLAQGDASIKRDRQ